ncbi:MAG: DoxX family protein [Gaiellales bacterium]
MIARVLSSSSHGWRGHLPLAIRLVTGTIFLGAGVLKFTAHASEVQAFEDYGFTDPDRLVYAIGLVELFGGAALVLGLLTRLAALGLAVNMAVATATAGPSIVNLALLVSMLALVVLGAGRFALDARLAQRLPSSRS